MFVSNIQFMFPNANDVSKRQCFQCMFPIYMEPFKYVSALWRRVYILATCELGVLIARY